MVGVAVVVIWVLKVLAGVVVVVVVVVIVVARGLRMPASTFAKVWILFPSLAVLTRTQSGSKFEYVV